MRAAIAVGLCMVLGLACGCTAMGIFPHTSMTTTTLDRANYKIVKANVVGHDTGFYFLGIIPIVSPEYTSAMEDLYRQVGQMEGRSMAMANVVQERSDLYLILFSFPRLSIRADFIEFFPAPDKDVK
jgi:hypothetical protein